MPEAQTPTATSRSERVVELERGFRRAGLPLFIEGHSATTDVFNRAVPLLGLVFIAEIFGAANFDWSPLANLAAIAGGLAILLGGLALTNMRNGLPPLGIPQRVGKTELTAFVLLPAMLPLIFGGQWRSAIVIAASNLLLLALIYGVVGYGLTHILRWVLGRMAGQVRSSLGLVAKALPLLAIFALLSFTTQEAWQIFPGVEPPLYVAILVLFVALGSVFLAVRIPAEARRLERDASADAPPLDRRQRLNVGLVMFVSQAVQVLIVSLALGVFFAVFGALAIDADLRLDWMGTTGNELFGFDFFGAPVEVTSELLRVAAGLAAFSGFYFAIAMLTDGTYREEFLNELTGEMSSSFAARAEYCRLRSGDDDG